MRAALQIKLLNGRGLLPLGAAGGPVVPSYSTGDVLGWHVPPPERAIADGKALVLAEVAMCCWEMWLQPEILGVPCSQLLQKTEDGRSGGDPGLPCGHG